MAEQYKYVHQVADQDMFDVSSHKDVLTLVAQQCNAEAIQVVWDFAELQARLKVVHSVHQVHGVQCHQHHLQMAETEIQECIVSMVAVYMQAISLIGQVAEEQVQYRIVRQQDVVRQAQVA
jgi:hypothetical protein